MKAYSLDLRERVLAYLTAGGSKVKACQLFKIGHDTIYRWLKQVEQTGNCLPGTPGPSGPRKVDYNRLREYVHAHPDHTLAEIASQFQVVPSTIGKAFRKLGITSKKKSTYYQERDEQVRQEFLTELETFNDNDIVYVDETGMNDNLYRPCGWSPCGEPIYQPIWGKKSRRINLIAGWHQQELTAPFRFEGSCNTQLFNTYLEPCLLPALPPGKIMVRDNASFHKSIETRLLIESHGCHGRFLPTYSPDLNPIENVRGGLKARLRNCREPFSNLLDDRDFVIQKMY